MKYKHVTYSTGFSVTESQVDFFAAVFDCSTCLVMGELVMRGVTSQEAVEEFMGILAGRIYESSN